MKPFKSPKKHFTPGYRYTSGSTLFVANERGDLVRVTPKKRDLRARAKYEAALRKVITDNNTQKKAS